MIKNLLKKTGLFGLAKEFKSRIDLNRFKNVTRWQLKYEGLDLSYSTEDWYSKWWFFPRYANGKIHEAVATHTFVENIKPNDNVFDIGGHLGYFSCISGQLASSGSVHVFEVDPKCINLIRTNVKINNLKNVVINNFAVSNGRGVVKIPSIGSPSPVLNIGKSAAGKHIEVNSISIDEYSSENGVIPNFMKIDVEGAEWLVLQGMVSTIEKHAPTLLIEIHVDILRNDFDTDYKSIIKFLISKGYSLYHIEAHRDFTSSIPELTANSELSGNTMILCKK